MRKVILTPLAGLLLVGSVSAQEEFFSEEGMFTAGGNNSANRHIIPVEAGMSVEVIVMSDDIDTTLNATMPNGETIYNDDYEGLNAGFMRTMSSGGSLEVVASPLSSGETGPYRIIARTLPPPGKIAVGQTVDGRLSGGNAAGDRYELSGEAGSRVVIDLRSYDFDAYLTVTDSRGGEMTDDDGGDEGYNSRISYRFDASETVTIAASSLGDEAGRYQLSVSELSNDVAMSVTGSLSNSSPRGHDGTRYERHEFEGEAGQTVTIMLESDSFDTVLYVSNPDGSNLARDDDGGENNNSEAVINLPETGTYTIYVTGFSESTGSYEITVLR
ncbi:MAG: PPC domain-containing protein [Pseudomonadota bacterium]